MFYKILGINTEYHARPTVYTGEVRGEPGDHPLIAALACEFGGRDGKPAIQQLMDWSGGDVQSWAGMVDDDATYMEVVNDGTVFHVYLADVPFDDADDTVVSPEPPVAQVGLPEHEWTVGRFRKAMEGLPDGAPLRMLMMDCPSDYLSIELDGLRPSPDGKALEMLLSIIDDEDRGEDDEDDEDEEDEDGDA